MSSTAKWLLILLLAVIIHAVYLAGMAANLEPAVLTYVFPYGTIGRNFTGSVVIVEAAIAGFLLVAFGAALKKS